MFVGEYKRIVDLAAKSRLPVMYQVREFVDAGGLMSYGANLTELNRREFGHVCGQNPQGSQAGGFARGATDQV